MKKYKAFVAEDDKKWQKIFQRNLEREGLECDIAENYLIAKEILPKNHYNIALLDIRLSETNDSNKDGLRIASHLHINDPDTAILIVTGHGTVKITRDALKEYNAVDVYEKETFNKQEFSNLVKKLLEDHNKRRSEIDIDYMSFLKDDYIKTYQLDHQLLTTLKPEGGNLNAVLERYIRPLIPLLRHKTHAGLFDRRTGYQGLFWSRTIGKPILISLFSGKKTKINLEEAKGIIPFLENTKIEEILQEESKLNVSVQVCSVTGIDFEDFESNYNFS